MTLEELYRDAMRAKENDSLIGVSLHFGKGCKRPAGFPRGQLLNETERGSLYTFNADKIIEWVKKQGAFTVNVPLKNEAQGGTQLFCNQLQHIIGSRKD